MNFLQECAASLRLVFTSETTCRLCFVTAPVVWIFGSFLLGVKAFTIYADNGDSDMSIYFIIFGLFMMLCGIFSASNTIHVCIQLPTSQTALKIQKFGQILVLGVYSVLLIAGFMIENSTSEEIGPLNQNKTEYQSLFYLQLMFLGLFLVTTISCMYA